MKRVAGILLVAALLSGCAAPNGESETLRIESVPIQRVKVEFTVPFEQTAPISRCITRLAADYSEKNNVNILLRYGNVQEQRLLSELISQHSAQLYLLPAEYIASFGRQGYLAAVDSQPERFYSGAAAYCQANNETFAIPYLASPMALLCNTALLEQVAMDLPQTWVEVLTVCEAVAAETEKSGFAGIGAQCESLGDIVIALTKGSGGKLVTRWGGVDQMNMQSEQVRAAIDFYESLLRTDKSGEYEQNNMQRAGDIFLSAPAALAFARPETLRMAQVSNIAAQAIPLPEGTQAAVQIYGLAIPRDTGDEQKQAAQAFAEWLGESKQLDRVLSAQYEGCEVGSTLLLPLKEDAGELSFYADHPEYLPFERQLRRMMKPEDDSGKLNQIKENALIPALRSILLQQATVDVALAEAQNKGNQILKN